MPNPIPLQVFPQSGLSFPWAFEGRMNLRAGQDGVHWSEVMQIYWQDLEIAITQLLGYSWRDTTSTPHRLRRKLPWQHPYFNQLWVKNVAEVSGLGVPRPNSTDPDEFFGPALGNVGLGTPLNFGPWADFERARIILQFWRPPYTLRSDEDIEDDLGDPQEWLRYVDNNWSSTVQVLSRDSNQLRWAPGATPGATSGLPGGVGQTVVHQRVSKTWYEIPAAAIFAPAQDTTPTGQALNFLYSQTPTVNPITGYQYGVGWPLPNAVNTSTLIPTATHAAGLTSGSATVTVSTTAGVIVGASVYGTGVQPGTIVLSFVANTSVTLSVAVTVTGTQNLTFTYDDPSEQLFGCYLGTLRYDYAEVRTRDLQLPPYLMQIPAFANNEPIAQVQYDVTFHFDLFDPPCLPSVVGTVRGHNFMPYPGNGLWYPSCSQQDGSGGTSGPFLTPHAFLQLQDLFKIL